MQSLKGSRFIGLLRRFRFRLAADGPVGMRPLVTLRPLGGTPMRVTAI